MGLLNQPIIWDFAWCCYTLLSLTDNGGVPILIVNYKTILALWYEGVASLKYMTWVVSWENFGIVAIVKESSWITELHWIPMNYQHVWKLCCELRLCSSWLDIFSRWWGILETDVSLATLPEEIRWFCSAYGSYVWNRMFWGFGMVSCYRLYLMWV